MFKGSGVAIVTPFKEDGSIDYEEFKKLVEFQIENKTDAIVVAGTTGEAATMSDQEQLDLIDYCVGLVNKRVPVIAGTGSNSTRGTIEMSKEAEKLGVDGLLIVTPYYNKPSQRGLKEHYLAVAREVKIPIILYAVPGRTGVNIEPETVAELAKLENIVGLKDAVGNLSYTGEVRRLCPREFRIYSGNDDLIVPLMSLGGSGVISVLANCLPLETHEMVYDFLEGRVEEAENKQLAYKEFIDSLFCESNPIPVKKALSYMGYKTGYLRLPLVEMDSRKAEALRAVMEKIELI